MDKVDQSVTVKVRDRVTFDTDEGIQAGYVNDLRRDLGNGELHAWVEVDHIMPGCFRAVPVSALLTSDPVGAPSVIGTDWAATLSDFSAIRFAEQYLCNFENALLFRCPACGHVGAVESQLSNYCQNDHCRRISPRQTQSHIADANTLVMVESTADRLARAESALRIHGFTESDSQLWIPPVAYRPIEIFDVEQYDMAYQAGMDYARRGEHELFPDENHPFGGLEGDMPLCRFHFFTEGGDPSVGEPSRAYWALSSDQSGTELEQILAASASAATEETNQHLDRAKRALLNAGFTDCGGQEWKPPIGQPPRFIDAISTTPPGWIDAVITHLIKLIENAEDLDICDLLEACSLLNAWSSEQYAQSIGFFPHLPAIENDDKKQIKLIRMEIAKSNAAAYLARYLPKDIDGDYVNRNHTAIAPDIPGALTAMKGQIA